MRTLLAPLEGALHRDRKSESRVIVRGRRRRQEDLTFFVRENREIRGSEVVRNSLRVRAGQKPAHASVSGSGVVDTQGRYLLAVERRDFWSEHFQVRRPVADGQVDDDADASGDRHVQSIAPGDRW